MKKQKKVMELGLWNDGDGHYFTLKGNGRMSVSVVSQVNYTRKNDAYRAGLNTAKSMGATCNVRKEFVTVNNKEYHTEKAIG